MSIPPWKQALLDKKRKQEEEEQRRKQEEEAKLKAIPAWKRAILERNSTKQATQSKPTQAQAAPSQQQTSTTLASLVSKAKPESTIPRENAPKANGWLKSTSIAATTSEKSTKPIVRTSSSSPPKPSSKLWPTVAPVLPLGRSPPTKAKHDAEGDVPAEATPTISKPLLERKLSYEREVAKASPPTERRPSAREKTEKGSPLIAGENKRREVVATTVATPSDNSIQKQDDAKGGLTPKRGSVRSLLGRFQRGGASDASNPTFVSGRSSLRSSHAKSVGETKKATSESEKKVVTMPAKVDTKASVEVGVESASENERKAEGNSPEVKMPVSTVGVVTTAPSKNVEMPKGKVESTVVLRETKTVVVPRTEKTESTEKKVETKTEKKKTLFDAVPQRREETSKEEVIELTREVVKENKSAAPAPSKDDVIEKTSPTSETEEAEEALQITNIDDDDDEEEVQVAPVTTVAKQQVEPPKTEDVQRRHSAQREPTKQADVSVALRGAGIESTEKKKEKERRRSSLSDPRKPKPQVK